MPGRRFVIHPTLNMKLHWTSLHSIQDVESLISRSFSAPCLIFKHSTRCEISAIAKYRLEDDWEFETEHLSPYFLDLIAHRDVSSFIADKFAVHHESPQVLLVVNGECVFDASHLDITIAEVQQALDTEATAE